MLLTVSLLLFTCYLQNLDSLPFSIYMLFTESRQSPFFDLLVIYRILTVSFFEFICYLQDLDSLPFSIYMLLTVSLFLFTCYLQNLDSLPFSIYMLFTEFWQSPFFNLHVIYRILTLSLFQFTCYLQNLESLPFSIYMLFTGSWQSPFFNLHVIYRILIVSLFEFTCYLQDLNCVLFLKFTCYLHDLPKFCFQNLQHLVSHLHVQIQKFTWYLHDYWKHVKVQKPCKLSFTVNFHGFTCYLHIIYIVCKFSIFPVIYLWTALRSGAIAIAGIEPWSIRGIGCDCLRRSV